MHNRGKKQYLVCDFMYDVLLFAEDHLFTVRTGKKSFSFYTVANVSRTQTSRYQKHNACVVQSHKERD